VVRGEEGAEWIIFAGAFGDTQEREKRGKMC